MTYAELQAAKKKALQERERAAQKVARLTEEARKLDTHFKIQLGGWLLACAKAAHNAGQLENFNFALETLMALAPYPRGLAPWLDDRLQEIQNKPPKPPRKKDPQKPA